jgi:hypothetical protein
MVALQGDESKCVVRVMKNVVVVSKENKLVTVFPEPLAPVSCFGHLRWSFLFPPKVQKHVTSHMTATRRV